MQGRQESGFGVGRRLACVLRKLVVRQSEGCVGVRPYVASDESARVGTIWCSPLLICSVNHRRLAWWCRSSATRLLTQTLASMTIRDPGALLVPHPLPRCLQATCC